MSKKNQNSKNAATQNPQADSKKEVKEYPEFEQKHIVTLKEISKWSATDTETHLEHNRILQPGYGALRPQEYISLALTTKEEWLTDIICPQVSHACKMNIAADLVTQFKVSAEDLNETTNKILGWINKNQPYFIETAEGMINDRLSDSQTQIYQNAIANMKKKYPNLDPNNNNNHNILEAFILVETEKAKKQITHEILTKELQQIYPLVTEKLQLESKSIPSKGANRDYSFLGAAGSGKSTITRQFLTDNEKLDYVVLATDDYRGVSLDETHDTIKTDQVFIRTQDTAYSIKELVQKRLEASEKRSNIILDCVSLENWHKNLLAKNAKTISSVACLDDIGLVPERAYRRALDEKSGPADKGRQVHTPSLLSGHASASARLLMSIPASVRTTLYNTNVGKGSDPNIMGYIDTTGGKHRVEITQLSLLSKFLAKANVNTQASFKGELYQDKTKRMHQFTYDAPYQAAEILKLAKAAPPYKPNDYDLSLTAENGVTYAKIKVENHELKLEVTDTNTFLSVLNKDDDDAKILKNIAMQIRWKDIESVRTKMQTLGKGAEKEAIETLVPQVEFIPAYERSKNNKDSFRRKSTQRSPEAKSDSGRFHRNNPLTPFFENATSYSTVKHESKTIILEEEHTSKEETKKKPNT